MSEESPVSGVRGGKSEGCKCEGYKSESEGCKCEGYKSESEGEGWKSEGLKSEGCKSEGWKCEGCRSEGWKCEDGGVEWRYSNEVEQC